MTNGLNQSVKGSGCKDKSQKKNETIKVTWFMHEEEAHFFLKTVEPPAEYKMIKVTK